MISSVFSDLKNCSSHFAFSANFPIIPVTDLSYLDVSFNNVVQGGVDLSSILLQQLHAYTINLGIPFPSSKHPLSPRAHVGYHCTAETEHSTGFAGVPDLAWQLYRSCERSPSPAFVEVAPDVSSLYIGLRGLQERLETDTYSADDRGEIQLLFRKSCETLQRLESILTRYQRTPLRGRAHWGNSHSYENFYGIQQLRSDLQLNVSMVGELNQSLSRSVLYCIALLPDLNPLTVLSSRSMNYLTQQLDDLVDNLNSGYETSSALSSRISNASIHNGQGWGDLHQELLEAGFSSRILSEQREYILKWLVNAVQAGRLDIVSEAQDVDDIDPESASMNTLRIDENNTDVNDANEAIIIRENNSQGQSTGLSDLQAKHNSSDAHLVSIKGAKNWRHSLTSKLKYVTLRSDQALERAVIKKDVVAVQKLLHARNAISLGFYRWAVVLRQVISGGHDDILNALVSPGDFMKREGVLEWCLAQALVRKKVEATVILVVNGARFESAQLAFAMTFATESVVNLMFRKKEGDVDHDGYAHFFLFNAAKYGHEGVFQSLVAQYGGINAPVNDTTAFHLACRSGEMKSIQLALELGANVKISDARGQSPLTALILGSGDARSGIGANLRILFRHGAKLKESSDNGETALHLAARYGHVEAVEALMQMGMDSNIKNAEGNTPLHVASKAEWVERSVERFLPTYLTRNYASTMLDLSAILKDPCDGIKDLFNGMKDPREEVYCKGNEEETVRLLLRYGALVNVRGKENITPLHLASQSEVKGRVKALIEHGADPHAVDDLGWTPLHFAVLARWQDGIDLIVAQDVDPYKTALVEIIGGGRTWMDAFNMVDLLRFSHFGNFRLNCTDTSTEP